MESMKLCEPSGALMTFTVAVKLIGFRVGSEDGTNQRKKKISASLTVQHFFISVFSLRDDGSDDDDVCFFF